MKPMNAVSSLAALAHDSRLAIYRSLVQAGPTGLSVSEIGAPLKIAPATLSFHLKELAQAGLIRARQDGRFIFYAASYDRMNALIGFLTEKCCVNDGAECGAVCAPRSTKPRSTESS